MKCEDFRKYLDNYENLTDTGKNEMTAHAAMCEKCQAELDFFLAMLDTARTLPKIEPPADFMDTLNARLDAEDSKKSPSKIVYHVRKNWKQYAALAACFALVAVLTANSGILLDRIEGTEDGVITEETVATGDNAVPNGSQEEASVTDPAPEIEESVPQAAEQPVTVAQTDIVSPVSARTTAPAARQRGTQSSVSSASVSEPVSFTEAAQTSAPDVTEEKTAVVSETQPGSAGSDYGIALKGVIQSATATEMAAVEYDMTVEEASASLKASRVIDSYSLAEGGESIALGRYYSIDQNGKPIMSDNTNTPTAIGSLKISSDDAEKAMDILNQYPHDENGNMYTTGSENVSDILTNLSEEGVTYTDYIIGGSEDVKFKIEFN